MKQHHFSVESQNVPLKIRPRPLPLKALVGVLWRSLTLIQPVAVCERGLAAPVGLIVSESDCVISAPQAKKNGPPE